MDIAYKKYIIGNVITESPNGSAYLIETLKEILADIESGKLEFDLEHLV